MNLSIFVFVFIVLGQFVKRYTAEFVEVDHENKILSRQKRFLIFPDGSSLQLVYCLTIPSVGMGNIFTIGWTAALAWELPHEPIHPFHKKYNGSERVDKLESLTSGGWALKKESTQSTVTRRPQIYYDTSKNYSSYIRPIYTNYLMKPGYSKIRYGTSPVNSYREYFKGKYVDYRPIYDALSISPYRKSNQVNQETALHLHPIYKEIHRKTRRDLFSKIERFLDAQRLDGKACLLKVICELSKSTEKKGTFMEEILKAIFKIKPYKNNFEEDEFDAASNEDHDCEKKYIRCQFSVWSIL